MEGSAGEFAASPKAPITLFPQTTCSDPRPQGKGPAFWLQTGCGGGRGKKQAKRERELYNDVIRKRRPEGTLVPESSKSKRCKRRLPSPATESATSYKQDTNNLAK